MNDKTRRHLGQPTKAETRMLRAWLVALTPIASVIALVILWVKYV